jgi:hypothetical protein
MAAPLISGAKPRLEALFVVAIISLIFVLMSPQLTSTVLEKLPWLTPTFGWLLMPSWIQGKTLPELRMIAMDTKSRSPFQGCGFLWMSGLNPGPFIILRGRCQG